jgi:quercetin dioxygenase-like cupin family protein
MAMGHTIRVTEVHAWVTVAVLLILTINLAVITPTMANDPDPLQDFCVAKNATAADPTINGAVCKPIGEVSSTDFKSAVLKNVGNTSNPEKVAVTAANVATFPGVNTQGISMVRIDWAKGGINPPHVHPRATEILFLVEGSLYVGFISTTNNTLFATYLQKGELFIFPRGLIHFQLNVGNSNAFAISALNSQNFGVSQVAAALFTPTNLDEQVLTKGFRTTEDVVQTIQKGFQPK